MTYNEPYKIPAGLLALSVHMAFFAVLIAGVHWQSHPHEKFAVELWDNLPAIEPVPAPPPPPPPEPVPQAVVTPEPPQPVKVAPPPPAKAEIELREKKVSKAKPAKPPKPVKPAKPTAKELKALKEKKAKSLAEEQRLLEEYAENRRLSERARSQAEQARVKAEVSAEVSAATAAEVGRYEDMIRSKIRRNIVMPPDVPENATSEFKVTLLPGGMVMDPVLLKSSGNVAYDNAVERAILKSQPLPVPADPGMQKMFRELRLIIRPEE